VTREYRRILFLWRLECFRRLFVPHYRVKFIENLHGVRLRHWPAITRIYLSCQFRWWYSHYAARHGASTQHWSEAYKEQT
jgi:hypothetical protein